MAKTRLIFIGTAEIGISLLKALAVDQRFEIATVMTAIDRPAGRGLEPQPSPIKKTAEALGLPLFQPTDINSSESVTKIQALKPDLILLMAYGQLLKQPILELPSKGCINVHGSLLPRYRGASPIQSALLAEDKKTGISLMQMVEKMDAGPVYATFSIPIESEDNASILHDKLAALAAEKTPDTLASIVGGKFKAKPQDEARATYSKKLSKVDGLIDWHEDAATIAKKIQAYWGWPGTFTTWQGKHLKILAGAPSKEKGEPGVVFEKSGKILVGTGQGSLELATVQLEGKKNLSISEFIKGYPDFIGAKLE